MSIDIGRTGGQTDGSELPLGLVLLAGAVSAAVLLPLLWLVGMAGNVGQARALDLLTSARTIQVLLNSALLVVGVTGASILLAVPLAYLTVRTDVPFRRFFTIAVSLPLVIPSWIGAFAYVSAFGPRGELQQLLAPLGVQSLPEIYGFEGALVVLTLYTYPYVYITTRASLKSLDTTLVDAARTLEHSRWEAFKRVTLPQIQPAVAAGSLLVALYALSDFGTPATMQYDVFTRVIYVEQSIGRDYASMLSLLLVAGTLVILAVESRIRGEERTAGRQGGRTGDRVRLGRWRWPAMLFPALVAVLALVVPLGILMLWLVGGGADYATTLQFEFGYVTNSIYVAALAALAATLAGLPIAYLAARHDARLTAAYERLSYVGYAIPGVVIGFAIVYFGSQYATPLYQTIPLLVFAYVVRFLPQSVGSTRASFLQVNPQLPEAARTLGRSSIAAFRSVTLPLIAPGLLGGAALVFLTTMKELPATLLLRPIGFQTLSTFIWDAQAAGHFGSAAVPALILLVVSGLSMLVILSREGYDVR
ncbi:ABC transporter permease [Halomicrococcus gelatinilyticus]|uniref:ABC transporter permease n=1 Tax=Halomicrococcus gelatinilyticus TaxID=1702103 RepID=UPI002E13B3B4